MGKRKIIIRKAIFLDRDGVINKTYWHKSVSIPPANAKQFRVISGVIKACHLLKNANYMIIVVTNQPDVGRGSQTKQAVKSIHKKMCSILPIDHIEVCYHPGNNLIACSCRKPLPGMILKSAQKFNIDLRQSWMVGDRETDIKCGHSAGCRTILINSEGSTFSTEPDYIKTSLIDAVTTILD